MWFQTPPAADDDSWAWPLQELGMTRTWPLPRDREKACAWPLVKLKRRRWVSTLQTLERRRGHSPLIERGTRRGLGSLPELE